MDISSCEESTVSINDTDNDSIRIQAIQRELALPESSQRTLLSKLVVLIVSALIFFAVVRSTYTPAAVFLLLMVIAIHEAGHFLAMKLFGYRDVRMFFIPFLGGAVSGVQTVPSAAKQTLTAMAGPVPGLGIGCLCLMLFVITRHPLWTTAAKLFIVINMFNFLPIYPLDGGRIAEYTLFSRHYIIEIVFKTVTIIALGCIALFLKAPFIGLFCVLLIVSLPVTYNMAKAAWQLRKILPPDQAFSIDTIPARFIASIASLIDMTMPSVSTSIEKTAQRTREIWRKALTKPPSLPATLGLVIMYGLTFVFGLFLFMSSFFISSPLLSLPRYDGAWIYICNENTLNPIVGMPVSITTVSSDGISSIQPFYTRTDSNGVATIPSVNAIELSSISNIQIRADGGMGYDDYTQEIRGHMLLDRSPRPVLIIGMKKKKR